MQALVKNKGAPRFLLLFGMARSGTSWVGKIFDSHPMTLYKHEPDRVMSNVPMAPRLDEAERLATPIQGFFSRLPSMNRAQVAGSLPVFAKQYRFAAAQSVHKASVLAAAAASSFRFDLPVFQCARLRRHDIPVVWKSIDSLGRLGVTLRVVENCKAIVLTRHPCGSISSTLRGEAQGKFSSSVPPSEDYGIMRIFLESAVHPRGLTTDHMRQFHPVERMAWIWVLMNEKAAYETQGIGRCKSVRYEDICCEPNRAIQELFEFSGLVWAEQTSDFIEASTLGTRPGRFDQLTQDPRRYYGIFKDPIRAAERWKSEMKPEDIDRVYRVLRQSDLSRLYPESEAVPLPSTA
jgi:hypothetical protein